MCASRGRAARSEFLRSSAYGLQRDRIYDQQGLPLEAFQAMQTLATAELTLLDAQVSYSLAQVRLHTAIGNPVQMR